MKKLEKMVVVKIPEDLREGLGNIKDPEIEIFYIRTYKRNGIEWEVYEFRNVDATEEGPQMRVMKEVMNISREINEEGGGEIEEFLFRLLWDMLLKDKKEKDIRDIFEEISD